MAMSITIREKQPLLLVCRGFTVTTSKTDVTVLTAEKPESCSYSEVAR